LIWPLAQDSILGTEGGPFPRFQQRAAGVWGFAAELRQGTVFHYLYYEAGHVLSNLLWIIVLCAIPTYTVCRVRSDHARARRITWGLASALSLSLLYMHAYLLMFFSLPVFLAYLGAHIVVWASMALSCCGLVLVVLDSGLRIMWRDRLSPAPLWLWLFLCLCVPSLAVAESWSRSQRDGNVGRGQRIVDALEAYQAEHGRLPTRLAELAPDYLPGLPWCRQGLWRTGFAYSHGQPDDSVHMTFYCGGWTMCRYERSLGEWEDDELD
jgi:hypothetical protein